MNVEKVVLCLLNQVNYIAFFKQKNTLQNDES